MGHVGAGRYLFNLRKALARMQPDDRKLLLEMTQRMASRKRIAPESGTGDHRRGLEVHGVIE